MPFELNSCDFAVYFGLGGEFHFDRTLDLHQGGHGVIWTIGAIFQFQQNEIIRCLHGDIIQRIVKRGQIAQVLRRTGTACGNCVNRSIVIVLKIVQYRLRAGFQQRQDN